jgi:hypothetical protein
VLVPISVLEPVMNTLPVIVLVPINVLEPVIISEPVTIWLPINVLLLVVANTVEAVLLNKVELVAKVALFAYDADAIEPDIDIVPVDIILPDTVILPDKIKLPDNAIAIL